MRDPHVQAIYFAVSSEDGISYIDPEPLSFSNHLGDFQLADGKLIVVPAEHFSAEIQTREAIEPFLRAWEIDADLSSNLGMIRFTFERIELIDRDPPPPGLPQVIQIKGIASASVLGQPSLQLTLRTYPRPPQSFRATPEAQHAHRRWIGYHAGKEPLQSMAYFVLTLLESTAGNRRRAAQYFNIEADILNTIGRLTSTKGNSETARKAKSGVHFQELSEIEKQWLEKVIALVIHRLGEQTSGGVFLPIRLSDLPSL